MFLDAFLWEEAVPGEQHYSAKLLPMDAGIERVEALLEEFGVPLDAVVVRRSGGLTDDNWTSSSYVLPPPLTSPYAWPRVYRIELDDETVVRVTWPHPTVEWERSATVLHVPSASRGEVLWWWPEGRFLVSAHEAQSTEEGRSHVASFLGDSSVFQVIEERIKEIWGDAS